MDEFINQLSPEAYCDLIGIEASCDTLFPEDLFISHDMAVSSRESFPKTFPRGPDEEEDETAVSFAVKARILLMGQRSSGKKSIMAKTASRWPLTIQSASRLEKEDVTNSSFITFQLHDVRGNFQGFGPILNAVNIFGTYAAVIFVIDVQDDYINNLQKFQVLVVRVCRVNPNIKFGIFIHKVDSLSDVEKMEVRRHIHRIACDDVIKRCVRNGNLSFYFTSICDHSVLEAVSGVWQKLNPYLPTLEDLLNIFTSHCRIQKAFLFNVVSKIYIATDSTPVETESFKTCCDMIDVVFDMSCIYGEQDETLLDAEGTSVIELNNFIVLYLRKVNRYIALICIVRMDIFQRRGLIEYNFCHFQEAVQEVLELWKRRKPLEITLDSMARHLSSLSTKYSHFPEESKYQTIQSPISGNSTGIRVNAQQSSCK